MRLLKASAGSLLVLTASVLLVAITPAQSAAPVSQAASHGSELPPSAEPAPNPTEPGATPPEPDHGVNETIHYTLWSGDRDDRTISDPNASSTRLVAARTDVPFDRPPQAAERWNRGDLGDFPETDRNTSVHPEGAPTANGEFVTDATVSVFAVQPSTRARIAPDRQPLYVAPNGTVLGSTDYRVELPEDDETGPVREAWTLQSHRINATRLLVDGAVVDETSGSHTVTLEYTNLDSDEDQTLQFTLVTEVVVEVVADRAVRVRECDESGTDCEFVWHNTTTTHTETVTVRESVSVVVYEFAFAGYRARYPNGDLGLVLFRTTPWLGYSVPSGEVRGVWRFYTTSDDDWDQLVRETEDGATTAASPMRPLQVTAYPIETGPTPSSRRSVTILDTYGREIRPPELPARIDLDALEAPYVASYGMATRSRLSATTTDGNAGGDVVAYGLVRGVKRDVRLSRFERVPINRTTLSVRVLETTDESVTVEVALHDAATGHPISTANRSGSVVVQDRRLNTTGNGTVTATVPRNQGSIAARYEPGNWWYEDSGYVGSSDTVYVRGTVLAMVATLFRAGVPATVVLAAAFLIDRLTGWRIWPPWRRM